MRITSSTVNIDPASVVLPNSGWLMHNTVPAPVGNFERAVLRERERVAVKRIVDHNERKRQPQRWFDQHR